MSERVIIGKIVGAFGIRGQVKVEMITSFPSRFDKGNTVFIDGKPVLIEASQFHKGRPLLKLKGISTMTEAENLQWKLLEAEGDVELDEDEFMMDDLIGLKVLTLEGEELGVVEAIEHYPAHDVVLVSEIRIPLIKEFIDEIDLDKEIMVVQLIYGMRPGED